MFNIHGSVNIHAGLPTPTTSTYTTEEKQLSCSFNEFQTPLDTSVNYIVMSLPSKTSILDPIPTSEVKHHLDVLSPLMGNIERSSVTSGCFPDILKKAVLHPKLKNADQDRKI